MVRIAICDDEIGPAQAMEEQIHLMPFQNIEVDILLSGEELLRRHLTCVCYHIILLDIEMPSVNGIETAMAIREKDPDVLLIFVTAHREYVYKIFEALPFRFIQKPVSPEVLYEAIKDAMEELAARKKFFFYKKGNIDCQIPSRGILYFEASNRKIKIVTAHKTDSYYGRFKHLSQQLNPQYFMQVHNSFIINMDYVTSFGHKEVILTERYVIPVSLKYREQARSGHLKYIERRCGKW